MLTVFFSTHLSTLVWKNIYYADHYDIVPRIRPISKKEQKCVRLWDRLRLELADWDQPPWVRASCAGLLCSVEWGQHTSSARRWQHLSLHWSHLQGWGGNYASRPDYMQIGFGFFLPAHRFVYRDHLEIVRSWNLVLSNQEHYFDPLSQEQVYMVSKKYPKRGLKLNF